MENKVEKLKLPIITLWPRKNLTTVRFAKRKAFPSLNLASISIRNTKTRFRLIGSNATAANGFILLKKS